MSENNQNIEPTQSVDNTETIAIQLQAKMNQSGIKEIKQVVLTTGKDFDMNALDALLVAPDGARFTGASTSSGLPADISEHFDIVVGENVEVFRKVSENTTIWDKEAKEMRPNPIKSVNANVKFPVTCFIPDAATGVTKEYKTNLHITPDNKSAVAELLKNKTAKGFTSHWNINNKIIGKLEIVTGKETAKPEKKGAEMEEPTAAKQ